MVAVNRAVSGASVLVLVLAVAGCRRPPPPIPHHYPPPNPIIQPNPIVLENSQPGAVDWFVPYPQWSQNHEVEGYTDQPSYAPGDTIAVKVSAQSSPVKWTLYRTGWYDGAGARAIRSGLVGATQQTLPPSSTWDVPCEPQWATTFTIAVTPDFVTGVYALKLTRGSLSSFVVFVVRDDSRKAELTFQRSDFTDAMYNNWDGAGNHSSYYAYHPQWISLDRVVISPASWFYPYSGGYFNYEYSMVRFLEREGYDVTYLSNLDVHQNPHALERAPAFLSVGHDEYWSPEMRDQIEGARNRGVHLGVFSSDTCDGVLRFRPGDPHAFSTNTTDATADNPLRNEWIAKPVDLTAPPDQNPGDTLLGTHYGGWCAQPHPDCLGDPFTKLTETDALRLLATTHPSLRALSPDTASIPAIIGYEYEVPYTGMTPLPFPLVTIGDVPSIPSSVIFDHGVPVTVAYQHPSGARVFNAGSMHWTHGLDGWSGRTAFRQSGGERECQAGDTDCFADESVAVRQLTVTILDDFGAKRGSPSPDLGRPAAVRLDQERLRLSLAYASGKTKQRRASGESSVAGAQ